MCVIKRINFRSLDRDPTVAMRFGALNRGRPNSVLKPRARSNDRWFASTRSTGRFSALRPIDAPLSATSPEMKITVWDLVPHGKNE